MSTELLLVRQGVLRLSTSYGVVPLSVEPVLRKGNSSHGRFVTSAPHQPSRRRHPELNPRPTNPFTTQRIDFDVHRVGTHVSPRDVVSTIPATILATPD